MMKSLQRDRRYRVALFTSFCVACASCVAASSTGSTIAQSRVWTTHEGKQAPKNVILLIGDGMGPEQVKAAGMYAHGTPGKLSFEQFPHQGEVTTYSANNSITDSAAGGTAIATGVKVNNGVISMAIPGDGQPLKTVLEKYQAAGKSAGLVTTTEMTHATPAAFAAHQQGRSQQAEIAQQYLNTTRPEVLFGGGGAGMSPKAAKSAGYTVVINRQQMQALDTETVTRVSGQFGQGHLPYESDGVGDLPHLREMAKTALNILDNDPDGLFLMIEGGRIDHAGHENHLQRNVMETLQFAETVAEVFKWAENNPDTLIIVTADHETGGLKVLKNNGQGQFPQVSWSSHDHTGANVGIYGWGPNSDQVSGTMENTDVFYLLLGQQYVTGD
ncbi:MULTISPECIES: alkaline phosphatase [Planktothricoides]|uniref:Alkaline phosphatase n=2 Tax=Planktothricoides raciborskii TaxID=132608 RepID=A0AAU8JEN9_9CYAN|nr:MULTISPECIES: alkaline phosphatase [Planktothricoides]